MTPVDFSILDKNQTSLKCLQILTLFLNETFFKIKNNILNNSCFYEFIEYSGISSEIQSKYKECYVYKKSGGRFKKQKCLSCPNLFSKWTLKWFLIKQDCIFYTNNISNNTSNIREMLLLDNTFSLLYGLKETGIKNGLILKTPTRLLKLKIKNSLTFFDMVFALKRANENSPYSQINRYLSFAPIRDGKQLSNCKWYIDGENYFEDIEKELNSAKEEIFITDWWLSPELKLKRTEDKLECENHRLDFCLLNAAKRNVKIYIIIYKEVAKVVSNDSQHTKQYLESLHPNIFVLRHPKSFLFLWSHHEKIVVVDQEIGFLGGIDLCFGRYDNPSHLLNDEKSLNFPGIDYYNVRKKPFENVKNYKVDLINRNEFDKFILFIYFLYSNNLK